MFLYTENLVNRKRVQEKESNVIFFKSRIKLLGTLLQQYSTNKYELRSALKCINI